jgi:hypothetical protein
MRYVKPNLVTLTLAELENTQMTARLQDDVIQIIPIPIPIPFPVPAPCRCQCQCQCQCQGQ